MLDRTPYNPTAYDDNWEDLPGGAAVSKWVAGILIALGLVIYGVACFVTGHGTLGGERASMDLVGHNAYALGVASCSLGLLLHCHYYWGNIYHLAAPAVIGKIVALLGCIGGLGYIIVHVGVLGH